MIHDHTCIRGLVNSCIMCGKQYCVRGNMHTDPAACTPCLAIITLFAAAPAPPCWDFVGEAIGQSDTEMAPLRARAKQLLDYGKLKELHWDSATGAFLDWGAHTEDVKVQLKRINPQAKPVRPPCCLLRP